MFETTNQLYAFIWFNQKQWDEDEDEDDDDDDDDDDVIFNGI